MCREAAQERQEKYVALVAREREMQAALDAADDNSTRLTAAMAATAARVRQEIEAAGPLLRAEREAAAGQGLQEVQTALDATEARTASSQQTAVRRPRPAASSLLGLLLGPLGATGPGPVPHRTFCPAVSAVLFVSCAAHSVPLSSRCASYQRVLAGNKQAAREPHRSAWDGCRLPWRRSWVTGNMLTKRAPSTVRRCVLVLMSAFCWVQEELQEELAQRRVELDKVDALEAKLDAEMAEISETLATMQAELGTFQDLEALHASAAARRTRLTGLFDSLQSRAAMLGSEAAAREHTVSMKADELMVRPCCPPWPHARVHRPLYADCRAAALANGARHASGAAGTPCPVSGLGFSPLPV